MSVEKTFSFEQIKFERPLADRTLTAQVYKVMVDSKLYAAKLFNPYNIDADRYRLRNYIDLSDDELENRFHPWKRELRVYKHIDKHIQGSKRTFFPIFYGTTQFSRSLCPYGWRIYHTTDCVPIIFLELLDGKLCKDQGSLQISNLTLQTARKLFSDGLDTENVHVYLHCIEKLEALHDVKVIHGDLKPDVFMNDASVICDFSRSWSWEDDEECLDGFRRTGPRSFEQRMIGERQALQDMVKDKTDGTKLRKRVPSWQYCLRCKQTMEDIISGK